MSGISKQFRKVLFAGVAIAISSTFFQLPANAYYWGYGRNWGTSILGSLGYLAYPLVNRGPYSANPLYSTSSYLRRSTQRALTAPFLYRPYYLNSYKDDEPFYDPRSRYRPVRLQNLGQDQIAKANWKKPIVNSNKQVPFGYAKQQTPPPSILSDDYDPFAIRYPEPKQIANSPRSNAPYTPPGNSATQIPFSPDSSKSKPKSSSKTSKAKSDSPIADGFVSTINTEFGGDIKLALLDPATRSWAKALGVIDNNKILKADFPQTRIHLIRQILMDSSLSSVSKLDAIKILLPRGGANRASKAGI